MVNDIGSTGIASSAHETRNLYSNPYTPTSQSKKHHQQPPLHSVAPAVLRSQQHQQKQQHHQQKQLQISGNTEGTFLNPNNGKLQPFGVDCKIVRIVHIKA